MTFAVSAISTMNRVVNMDGYLKAEEVAKRLHVSARTVVRWAKRGDLQGAIKQNPYAETSPYLIPEEAIEAFLREREKGVVRSDSPEGGSNRSA